MALSSADNLEHTGLADQKRVASGPLRQQLQRNQSLLCQREKRRVISPSYQVMRWERVRMGKSRTLARKGGFSLLSRKSKKSEL